MSSNGKQGVFPFMDEPSDLPPSKLKGCSGLGLYAWSRSYAGFAPEFAEAVMQRFSLSPGQIVIDPFVGSGTSAVASLAHPCSFVGIDLDPFSALLTKAKNTRFVPFNKVFELLDSKPSLDISRFSEDVRFSYSVEDLQYASGVFEMIERRTGKSGNQLWRLLLSNENDTFSTELLALASLVSCSKKASNTVRGSNPVWYKRSLDAPQKTRPSLRDVAYTMTKQVCRELEEAYTVRHINHSTTVYNGDFSSTPISLRSIDFMITSPPYLSRLDYVVNHLAELSLLSGMVPFDLAQLRGQMMGTTKMVNGSTDEAVLPVQCRDVLHSIRTHSSKASGTYYYRFYTQYFIELYRFLQWTKNVMRPGGMGFLVIQDSYYKEIRISVSSIITEMASTLGVRCESIRTQEQTNSIGSMDPKQRGYSGTKVLNEEALFLQF